MKSKLAYIIFASLTLTSSLWAHGAHEHGVAHVKIAYEQNKISFELQAPSETFYGFEHEAKTDAEKKAKDEALSQLKTNFQDLVVFDSELNCTFKNTRLEVKKEDGHSDVEGSWTAECKKSPSKTFLTFRFSKAFPRLNEMRIELLSDQKQSQEKLKKGDGRIQL